MGFGLNARGAMELVIASIGLSVGVLNEATYAMVVLIAVLTTTMAAPSMRWSVRRAEADAPSGPEPPISTKKGAMIA